MTEDDDPMGVFESIDSQPKGNKRRAVEEIYQKKTQLEHILLRPDTYIGSVERTDKAVSSGARSVSSPRACAADVGLRR